MKKIENDIDEITIKAAGATGVKDKKCKFCGGKYHFIDKLGNDWRSPICREKESHNKTKQELEKTKLEIEKANQELESAKTIIREHMEWEEDLIPKIDDTYLELTRLREKYFQMKLQTQRDLIYLRNFKHIEGVMKVKKKLKDARNYIKKLESDNAMLRSVQKYKVKGKNLKIARKIK